MKFDWSLKHLQAFSAKCLARMIVNEEDPEMRALYRDYLNELEAEQAKPSEPRTVFVSRRGRVI
ncbi:hypothetical protein [Saccharibacillus sacchari]|uniref:Uncharacterized protein n=1 Tax=Saccharibacillus sacchari TaxID=456493 RepID=A0ACC6PHK5_9BACL